MLERYGSLDRRLADEQQTFARSLRSLVQRAAVTCEASRTLAEVAAPMRSQGVGSVLGGPAAAWMHDATGSWFPVFWLIIALDGLTAVLALCVLKPARASWLARQQSAWQAARA